jgi:hypothetical protein
MLDVREADPPESDDGSPPEPPAGLSVRRYWRILAPSRLDPSDLLDLPADLLDSAEHRPLFGLDLAELPSEVRDPKAGRRHG